MANFHSARFSSENGSFIDMMLEHPRHGWIPITITEREYPDLWGEAVAGPVAPYQPTSESDRRAGWRLRATLSRAKFCLAIYRAGILPLEEAIAAGRGDWPDSFTPLLDRLPDDIDPSEARILWAGITEIDRMHPLFEAAREHFGMTPEQADAVFGGAA